MSSATASNSVILVKSEQVTAPSTEQSIGLFQRDENVAATKATPPTANPSIGWLRWAIDRSGVFESQEEEVSAVQYATFRHALYKDVNENSFYQWGLRYLPTPGEDNIFRTVVIDKLPKTATLDRVLPQIRGGAVFSASLADTWTITGSLTALITFVHQNGAMNFLRLVGRDGFFVGMSCTRVRPVPTPTYVMAADIETQIARFGRTRCLVVSSRRLKELKKEVHRVLSKSRLRHYVECFGERDTAGEVTIRFHSVKMAWAACLPLVNDARLKGILVKPAADPCSLL